MATRTPDPFIDTDPLGVIADLIVGVESTLDRASIADVVADVAGGRAKRRRLAQALLQRPALLTDGRSPAPRVIGNLLIALRDAGAVRISPPVCTDCGKQLRTLQRRGEDWYCGVCGPRLEPCAGCGKTRRIARRDHMGRPLCAGCRPDDGADSMRILREIVTAIDPGINATSVNTAIHTAAKPGQRHRLARVLRDQPELLTGDGAKAPVPAVLRLIDALLDAGANGIVRPACPHCGRVIALVKPRDGLRLCRNCVAKSRAETCYRCGAHREAATRDEHRRPLCPNCFITDPANLETCTGCRRRRKVNVRTPDGPLCPTCTPATKMTCSICARSAPAVISKITGLPWCNTCKQRRARCVSCGNLRPVRGGSMTDPLCATCTRPDPSFWHTCSGCGQHTQNRWRRCSRCSLRQRLRELLRDRTGEIHPKLRNLHDNLTTHDRPGTVLAWLSKDTASRIVRELASGERPLSHAALDELPDTKPLRHLRSVLVATGALPPRDEHLIRLEQWITATVAERDDPEQRQLLHRYAIWHALHRLRRRNNGKQTTHGQAVTVQQHLKAAITLLDWLTTHGLDLDTARQGDLDTWLTSEHATGLREAGHFVRWAKREKLTRLDFAATKWDGPNGVIDAEAQWEQARRLLHDQSIKAEDRVAGLLVLLYAQWPAAISRLTLDQVDATEKQVRLRLGREPIVLPDPLAALVRELIDSRNGHATIGDQGTSPWLFPGGRPGRPISAARLGERLRQLGLRPGQARSTALFGLATELPAALLARLLGIHISVAVAWQRASSGDWTSYAADYSRRQHLSEQANDDGHSDPP
ncbi:MAG: hypothetical protein QOF66_3325 [Mycobacterium sp.]|uniref:hypothetical protein n=1 Tax=Mycobacterium sp. TaxID=1785 RepID=UPI0028BB0444|nr:hypothetical protein [Mycobacterium sp.]